MKASALRSGARGYSKNRPLSYRARAPRACRCPSLAGRQAVGTRPPQSTPSWETTVAGLTDSVVRKRVQTRAEEMTGCLEARDDGAQRAGGARCLNRGARRRRGRHQSGGSLGEEDLTHSYRVPRGSLPRNGRQYPSELAGRRPSVRRSAGDLTAGADPAKMDREDIERWLSGRVQGLAGEGALLCHSPRPWSRPRRTVGATPGWLSLRRPEETAMTPGHHLGFAGRYAPARPGSRDLSRRSRPSPAYGSTRPRLIA